MKFRGEVCNAEGYKLGKLPSRSFSFPGKTELLDLLAIGVGKIYREPRTEPKLPRTGTEGTRTEKVRFPFGSMIIGIEVSQ